MLSGVMPPTGNSRVSGGKTLRMARTAAGDTNYTGFKLGAQYKLNDKTDLGFTYRSEVDFEAEGNLSGSRHTVGGGVVDFSETSAKVGTLFPAAWNLSVSNRSCDNWRLLGEYLHQFFQEREIELRAAARKP